MKTESPTKVMARTSTTLNPYLTGEPTRWPTPELLVKAETGVLQETPMEALKVKPQRENNK